MSVNWTTQDIVSILRTKQVKASKVRVGDVLVPDDYMEHVARIEKAPDGKLSFYDAWDNGTVQVDPESEVTILHPSAFNRKASLDMARVRVE